MKRSKLITSLILNCLTVVAVLTGIIMIFFAVPHQSADGLVSETSISAFRLFTTDSNVLAGIFAVVFIVYEALVLAGKINEIPTFVYILKSVGTVGVAVTVFTVLFYLAPFAPSGFLSMFAGRDLFFHLIAPLLSLIAFAFFENTRKVKFKYTVFGIVPIVLYGIIYAINAFSHTVDGKVPFEYDWYGFAQGGVLFAIVALVIMIAVAFGISALLWLINAKLAKNRN